jgi:outer membrane protein assembly factor BamB
MKYLLSLFLLFLTLAARADWPQFRGPAATGGSDDATPPVEWSADKNVAWTADLPGEGFSGPVVVGDKVFVTGTSGHEDDRLHVVCYDANNGKPLCHRQYWATGRTAVYEPEMRVATPTPLATLDRVYAFYSSNDLACLDHEGNLIWLRGLTWDYPNATSSLGMASSPAFADGTVICQLETDDASFAIGLDAATGENRWKIDRPRKANWTSPVTLDTESGPVVLLEGADGVQAVAPATGETLWKFAAGGSTISSVTATDGLVFVPADGITAVRLPSPGSNPETIWNNKKLSCSFVSPLAYRGKVYAINSAGVLNCADAKTGELDWQLRLGGDYWATPAAADGRIYCLAKDGIVKVVDVTGPKGKIAAENQVGEPLVAPPALAGDALYLRTDTKLWKVAAN